MLALSACVAFWPAIGAGQAAAVSQLKTPALSLEDLDSASVSAFADRQLPSAMRDGKIPGAVFVVVRNGAVLCQKAYGLADLKTKRPVTTDQTLFRVASLSKILTAALALQQVQQHRLDLEQNVNHYLQRFKIAPAFDKPVTLFDLLTHSAGFDQCELGYAAKTAARKLSLRAYLKRYQPIRVRPPGWCSVYDNYGFALAGYLVQRAAGIPFAEYARQQLLDPLDMEHSSFSPGPKLRQHLATGYWLDVGEPRPCVQHYINITPAAGLCTTAADMSDFLIALLANRRPDGSKMFAASVLTGLKTQQFVPQPEVPGRCFGFNAITLAGRSALRQFGQWPGFDSVLLLFPKQHCGLFLAYNLCDYEGMAHQVSRKFAEIFIPAGKPAGATDMPMAASSRHPDTSSLAGYYLSSRSSHEAPSLNFPHEIRVTQGPNGTLIINGEPYRQLAPLVFAKIETNRLTSGLAGQRLAFIQGPTGAVTYLLTQSGTFRRAYWFESKRGRQFLLGALTAIFFSVLLLWPVMVLLRGLFAGKSPKPASPPDRKVAIISMAARGTALLACGLALWFEASLALAEAQLKPFADFYGLPAAVHQLLWALPVLLGLSVVVAVFSIIAWCRRLWHPVHRFHYSLLVVACGLFLWFFNSQHLLFPG